MLVVMAMLGQTSITRGQEVNAGGLPRPFGPDLAEPPVPAATEAKSETQQTATPVAWWPFFSKVVAAQTEQQQLTSPPRQPDPNSPKWLSDLPYRPLPDLGNWPILPSGPGYYSLLDQVLGNWREYMPRSAYPPYALMRNSMFDADWRYLDDPDYISEDFFDRFHNVHLGDDWLFNTGGQADIRHMAQYNARLTGKTDDFDLMRIRPYADFWYQDIFRFYGEMIAATSTTQTLTPLKTDRDAIDFLNLFIGVKLTEIDGNGVFLRVGRQELLVGSERLVTPLEWGNTRQTFQGVHLLWSNGTFDFDGWWTRPVAPNADGWSWVDNEVQFSGLDFNYHSADKLQLLQFYWMYLDNLHTVKTDGITQDPTNVHTLGGRWKGQLGNFLWDIEPDVQLGDRGSQSILAGATTTGAGYYLPNLPMNPTVWAYYDWASGSQNPGHGEYSTFNQLYGFGHYYLGFMDLIGRENIRDVNFHLYLFPEKWINFNLQYHILALDTAKDALYSPAGSVSRVSLNGTAGTDVGQELTFICNFHLGPHSDILIGWSKLYAGDYIRNTAANAAGKADPEMWYAMYNIRW